MILVMDYSVCWRGVNAQAVLKLIMSMSVTETDGGVGGGQIELQVREQ